MAAELTEMGAERSRKPEAPEVWLQRLVDAESMERQARSMRMWRSFLFTVIWAASNGPNRPWMSIRSGNWPVVASWRRPVI